MANGQNTLFNLLGQVNSNGALRVTIVAVTGTVGPASALATKACAVDASNRLVVTYG